MLRLLQIQAEKLIFSQSQLLKQLMVIYCRRKYTMFFIMNISQEKLILEDIEIK